jgi:hypothetical protein
VSKGSGLEGADDLIQALHYLPQNLQKQVFARWVVSKAREIARAAKAAAPRGATGNLQAGIVARAGRAATLRKIGSLARAVVIGKRPAFHFHWVNHGTPPGLNKAGNRRGKGRKGNPFLDRVGRPKLAGIQAEISTDLARQVQATLNRAVRRTMRRVG